MKILIVGNPLFSLNLATDTGIFMLKTALRKGHELCWVEEKDIFLEDNIPVGRVQHVLSCEGNKSPLAKEKKEFFQLDTFDSIWIRKDPPFDASYLSLCWILKLLENKVHILNAPSVLLTHHEKLIPLELFQEGYLRREDLIPSIITYELVNSSIEGSCLKKPWLGHGGRGIEKYSSFKKALSSKSAKKEIYIYQKFLEEIYSIGDRRVFFIDGEYSGDILRTSNSDNYLMNLSQGAEAVLKEMNKKEKENVKKVGLFLKKHKIALAGIDMIGSYVNEVNITAPTGFVQFFELSGKNLAEEYLAMVEKLFI